MSLTLLTTNVGSMAINSIKPKNDNKLISERENKAIKFEDFKNTRQLEKYLNKRLSQI
ncbi:MAG: hypothetical protein LW595_03330 [Rickettsiales bacterium]|nr:hypothetical protein [Rickettsiales bacterium]